jgi:hypothetical protein
MFRTRHLVLIALFGTGILFLPNVPARIEAMPVFAQAYGLDCKACHTQVPSLNAYGRYIQRTMYSALDPEQYKKTFPIWIGEQANYDSGNDQPKVELGNLAVHFVGDYQSFTSHIQQWVQEDNQGGPFDTGWISENHLFKDTGHIVLGKMPAPGPSFFSQWFDVAPFAGPQMQIGEHAQLLSATRWGGKFTYATATEVAEAGYYGSTADLNGATDWSSVDDDKGTQYHVAFGNASKPFTAGIVGNMGYSPLVEGGYDRYSAFGAYVQTDPSGHFPGVILYAQNGNDGNPIATGVGAHSNAYSAEVYFPLLAHQEYTLSLRREMTNDGLGDVLQYGYINLGVRLNKYLHATGQMTMTNNATPSYQYYIWLTVPLVGEVKK